MTKKRHINILLFNEVHRIVIVNKSIYIIPVCVWITYVIKGVLLVKKLFFIKKISFHIFR